MISCHCSVCDRDFTRLRRRGSMTVCSRCSGAVRLRAWVAAHPGRRKQYASYGGSLESKKRYALSERGKQKGREKAKRHYHKDVQRSREYMRQQNAKRYAKNPEPWMQNAVLRRVHVKRATPPWVDYDALNAIYRQARRLTADTGIQYTVDHIVPLRAKAVSGLHVPHNLQILTLSENCSKKNTVSA